MQNAIGQRPIYWQIKKSDRPADGTTAAASPYWEFGTSRWQL
jgi:hypothetical protein